MVIGGGGRRALACCCCSSCLLPRCRPRAPRARRAGGRPRAAPATPAPRGRHLRAARAAVLAALLALDELLLRKRARHGGSRSRKAWTRLRCPIPAGGRRAPGRRGAATAGRAASMAAASRWSNTALPFYLPPCLPASSPFADGGQQGVPGVAAPLSYVRWLSSGAHGHLPRAAAAAAWRSQRPRAAASPPPCCFSLAALLFHARACRPTFTCFPRLPRVHRGAQCMFALPAPCLPPSSRSTFFAKPMKKNEHGGRASWHGRRFARRALFLPALPGSPSSSYASVDMSPLYFGASANFAFARASRGRPFIDGRGRMEAPPRAPVPLQRPPRRKEEAKAFARMINIAMARAPAALPMFFFFFHLPRVPSIF